MHHAKDLGHNPKSIKDFKQRVTWPNLNFLKLSTKKDKLEGRVANFSVCLEDDGQRR